MKEEYEYLKTLFKIESRSWSMIHENYSSFIFCDANKKILYCRISTIRRFCTKSKKSSFHILLWN